MVRLADLKKRRTEIESYLEEYDAWRKKLYYTKLNQPKQYNNFISRNLGGRSERAWLHKKEARVNHLRDNLKHIEAQIKQKEFLQTTFVTLAVASVVILAGVLLVDAPFSFTAANTAANEILIDVPENQNIVTAHLFFENSNTLSCSDVKLSIGGINMPFLTENEIYDENGCRETDIKFSNVNYNIKDSIYEVTL